MESHAQLQASFDRANGEIAEAVKAIDERNKAKAKEKTAKKEGKEKDTSKGEEAKSKPDETLPLWWTDKSAAAPGATPVQPECQSQAKAPSAAEQSATKVTEVMQQ